jgi:pimeloyl-ACP methyl ester carboxylesterase
VFRDYACRMSTPESLRKFDDPNFFKTRIVQANGLRFEVAEYGEGEKLALCLHGFPESSYSWRYQMTLLAELGYRVWAPNLRGYGGTERPSRVSDYKMEVLVEDVGALIDAANAKEVVLLAHDWGGAIAWEFMLKKTRPVDRFIIMNIPHPKRFAQALKKPFGPQFRRSWYIFLFQLPWLPEWYLAKDDYRAIRGAFKSMAIDKTRFPPEVLKVYRDLASAPGAVRAMLAYYRAALRFPPKVSRTKIEVPTLMIWGEDDTALGKELTYGTDELVSKLTLRYIPQCSHWVQQEKPEIVNAMVRAWLSGEATPEARDVN